MYKLRVGYGEPMPEFRTLSEDAYFRIRQAIRDGDISQGVRYSENDLARTLGMSRTPVREAVLALAREGLLEVASQRGFMLRKLSADQRREIFDLRLLLEPYAAGKLAAEATPGDVARLRGLISGQRELPDGQDSAFLALDEDFHLLMPQLLGLERTHRTIAGLRGAMWLMGFEALALPRRRAAVIMEHGAIVDAIERGDPDGAAKAAEVHITNTAAAVLTS